MKKQNSFLVALFLLLSSFAYGEEQNFAYQRELYGVSEQWHKVLLPEDIYGKISKTMSDIRIIAINDKNDTVQIPYLLSQCLDIKESKKYKMRILNTTKGEKGHYFTFEIDNEELINEISLDFEEQNFNWTIELMGSQDQDEWFTLLENYRILSIHNESTNFNFTKIKCPDSKFRFYRILVKSPEKPHLLSAKIRKQEEIEGKHRIYKFKKTEIEEDKKYKQSKIDLSLSMPLMLNCIQIEVNDSFDYYRPISISYLVDSIQSEKGWKYNYKKLTSGTLNSLEKNEFCFDPLIVQKLRITITNNDNQPLNIGEIRAKAYVHELIARFTQPDHYYLVYGNSSVTKARYDIENFVDKIPKELKSLELGKEQLLEEVNDQQKESFFDNQILLWLVLLIIALTLGISSVKMMRKE